MDGWMGEWKEKTQRESNVTAKVKWSCFLYVWLEIMVILSLTFN